MVFGVKFCYNCIMIRKCYCWKNVFYVFDLYVIFYDGVEIVCVCLIYVEVVLLKVIK